MISRVLFGVLAAALGLRLYRLGWHDAWSDEGFSIWLASLPWEGFWSVLLRDAHPPLFYLLLRGWLAVVPDPLSDFWMRLPFALAGVGTVLATWWLGRKLLDAPAALLGTAFVALSGSAIMLDQEIRMYALLALFCTLSSACFVRLEEEGRGRVVLYAAVTVLALYTHYLALFFLLGHLVAAVLLMGRDGLRRWLVGAGMAALAFAPWVWLGLRAQMAAGAGPPHAAPDLLAFPAAIGHLLGGFGADLFDRNPGQWWGAVMLFVSPVLLGSRGQAGGFLALAAGVPLLAAWVGSQLGRVAFFTPKYFTFVLPPLYLLAAAGLVWLARRGGAARALAILTLSIMLISNAFSVRHWSSDPEYQKSRWKDAVAFLRTVYKPGDAVLVMNSFQVSVVERYLASQFGATAPRVLPVRTSDVQEMAAGSVPPAIGEVLSHAPRVWVLLCSARQVDPQMRLLGTLGTRGLWLQERVFEVHGQPDAGVTVLLLEPVVRRLPAPHS